IEVIGDVNTPPTFTELSVELPQGGERSVDLRSAVVDPDPDEEFEFLDVEVDGEGFEAEVDDGTLTATATATGSLGATGTIDLVVSDGDDEAPGTIQVQVVGSDEPLATVGADAAETFQGQPVDL